MTTRLHRTKVHNSEKGIMSEMENRYPRFEINLANLQHNAATIVDKCSRHGIQVAGVIKGCTGLPEAAKAIDRGGVAMIASSRLEQIEDAINAGSEKPILLIRTPMLSEIRDVIRLTNISLNSDLEVLKALNEEARAQDKIHQVILMVDLGDLREGYWEKDELTQVAEYAENELSNIKLIGVGTNLGCYGAIVPTRDKLDELVEVAEKIEAKIGHELEYIAGAATLSLMRIWDNDIPERINLLRVGEGILTARSLSFFHGYDLSELSQEVFRLKAEVIEVKNKPSYPVGTITVDAFGRTPTYTDRGMRKRALVAVGKVDYGDPADIFSAEKGVEILGASSDHTIVDIEDAERDFKVGDIMTFDVCYSSIVYLTNCRNVNIAFV